MITEGQTCWFGEFIEKHNENRRKLQCSVGCPKQAYSMLNTPERVHMSWFLYCVGILGFYTNFNIILILNLSWKNISFPRVLLLSHIQFYDDSAIYMSVLSIYSYCIRERSRLQHSLVLLVSWHCENSCFYFFLIISQGGFNVSWNLSFTGLE